MRVLDRNPAGEDSGVPDSGAPAGAPAGARDWPESNCYVDLILGIVRTLRLEPRACLAFTLTSDFEDDQWTFYKPPHSDLVDLYGLRIEELNVWRPVLEHVTNHVDAGRLPLVEVDAFYLPDTAQTDYRRRHSKTTIGVNAIDVASEHLEYFHNSGYYELAGADFLGLFRLDRETPEDWLAPYCEIAKVDRVQRLDEDTLRTLCLEKIRGHLSMVPDRNPVAAYGSAVDEQLRWVVDQGETVYHEYVFATLRQCGSCYEHAALMLEWLAAAGNADLGEVAGEFRQISATAKMLVMKTARMAATGRIKDVSAAFHTMARAWEAGMAGVARLIRT